MNEAESKRLLSDDYGREGISRRAFLGTAGGAALFAVSGLMRIARTRQ